MVPGTPAGGIWEEEEADDDCLYEDAGDGDEDVEVGADAAGTPLLARIMPSMVLRLSSSWK